MLQQQQDQKSKPLNQSKKAKKVSWWSVLKTVVRLCIVVGIVWYWLQQPSQVPVICNCPFGLTPIYLYYASQDGGQANTANLYCTDPAATQKCNAQCRADGSSTYSGGFSQSLLTPTCLPKLSPQFYDDAATGAADYALTYDQSGLVSFIGGQLDTYGNNVDGCYCSFTISGPSPFIDQTYFVYPNDCAVNATSTEVQCKASQQ